MHQTLPTERNPIHLALSRTLDAHATGCSHLNVNVVSAGARPALLRAIKAARRGYPYIFL
jgi:hypothetical protein